MWREYWLVGHLAYVKSGEMAGALGRRNDEHGCAAGRASKGGCQ
jgi:hypothetical protein